MKILLVDHQDSFVYNLYQQLAHAGARVTCLRFDRPTREAERADPDGIVLSPGPGHPRDLEMTRLGRDVLGGLGASRPVLGVCLGHQLIADFSGGRVVRADRPVHGETTLVRHEGVGIFRGMRSPIAAARYHSLVVDRTRLPSDLSVVAHGSRAVVMGIAHQRHPWFGVQFHPESYLTEEGDRLIHNFLSEVRR